MEPEEPDCFHFHFSFYLSHVLLSGQRDSFSKYDSVSFIKVGNFCFKRMLTVLQWCITDICVICFYLSYLVENIMTSGPLLNVYIFQNK